MLTNAEITKKAREALKGKWAKTIGIFSVAFIVLILSGIALELVSKIIPDNSLGLSAAASIGGTIIEYFLLSPFSLGITYVFYRVAFKNPVQAGDLLHAFGGHKYWRNLMVLVLADIASSIVGVIIAIPVFICLITTFFTTEIDLLWNGNTDYMGILDYIRDNPNSIFILFIGIIISLILFAIITTIFGPVLENITFIIARNQKIGGFKSIRHGFRITKGNKAKYWSLFFRFTGWYMIPLIPAIIYIPLWFYVLPPNAVIPVGIICGILSLLTYLVIRTYSNVCFAILYQEMEKRYAEEHPDDPYKFSTEDEE